MRVSALKKLEKLDAIFLVTFFFFCVAERYFRRFPLFAGRGEEYLRELDAFVETGFRGLLVTWLRATRFDILVSAESYFFLYFK